MKLLSYLYISYYHSCKSRKALVVLTLTKITNEDSILIVTEAESKNILKSIN